MNEESEINQYLNDMSEQLSESKQRENESFRYLSKQYALLLQ